MGDSIGAIANGFFSGISFPSQSSGTEETTGNLAEGNIFEETAGELASNGSFSFDFSTETAGQVASSGASSAGAASSSLCLMA